MAVLDVVVITSDALPTRDAFVGYAYVGADMVVGEAGYADYVAATGRQIEPGGDGCYLLIRVDPGEPDAVPAPGQFGPRQPSAVLSTDGVGACKLFLYRDGQRWAVSNSFYALVEEVRRRSWPVTTSTHLLGPWSTFGPFWMQLASFDTHVEEIHLVPRQAMVRLSASGAEVVEPDVEVPRVDPEVYRARFDAFVQTWVSRLVTVLSDGRLRVSADLTGGLDSRTVLALLLAARGHGGADLSATRVWSNPAPYTQKDFRLAKNLAQQFNVPFNPEDFSPGPSSSLTGEQQFDRWRDLCFGTYGPMYGPGWLQPGHYVPLGGQGGSSHRAVYPRDVTIHAAMRRDRGLFSDDAAFEKAAVAFERDLHLLQRWNPGISAKQAHFQEFRERFHGNLHPQYRTRMVPLASTLMHAASRSLTQEKQDHGQALADVMAVTAPDLLDVPFDQSSKTPTEQIRADLAAPLEWNLQEGRVYGIRSDLEDTRVSNDPDFYGVTAAHVQESLGRLPGGVLPEETVAAARAFAAERPSGGLARPSMPAHAVLLADYLTR